MDQGSYPKLSISQGPLPLTHAHSDPKAQEDHSLPPAFCQLDHASVEQGWPPWESHTCSASLPATSLTLSSLQTGPLAVSPEHLLCGVDTQETLDCRGYVTQTCQAGVQPSLEISLMIAGHSAG